MLVYEVVLEFDDSEAKEDLKSRIERYRGNHHDTEWQEIMAIQTRIKHKCVVVVLPLPENDAAGYVQCAAKIAIDRVIGESADMEKYAPVIVSMTRLDMPVFVDPRLGSDS